jgi:hypothetical protein
MNFSDIQPWLPALASALVLLVLAMIALKFWWGRRAHPNAAGPDLHIDLDAIGLAVPPPGPVRLELYGTPVRLRVLVAAPAGRHQSQLHEEDLPILLNQFLPGLADIFSLHLPVCRCWPAQLSSQGFSQSFFNHVALPGNRGKGTPWTSLTGKFQVGEQGFLVGLVCCSETSNSLSQFIVEHEGQWFDTLRIRQDPS